MRIDKIPRDNTGLFSNLANTLVYRQEQLVDLLNKPFSKSAFAEQIKEKGSHFSKEARQNLVSVLSEAYVKKGLSEKQKINLENLAADTTFTVTTGHQLSLLTGPLYFVFKILHVVKLAEELKLAYPTNDFVPIFWMASEDHDFSEINELNLFQKELRWQTDQKGPVGRFTLENWSDFINEVRTLFQNHPDSEVLHVLEQYKGETLGESTFSFVNALFEKWGVLVLDADHPVLKKQFAPIIRKELSEKLAIKAVEESNKKLESLGFAPQAHAREINLFLLSEQSRERIQAKEDVFFVEGKGNFSSVEILQMVAENPAQFSPNVILRPLYQECILPNLCYVGGGGEMAYWLQLKSVFEAYKVPFPLIQVRNSMLLVDAGTLKKMEKVRWNTDQLFEDLEKLKKQFVLQSAEGLDFNELREKQNLFISATRVLVDKVDRNLSPFIEAEMTRFSKQVETIEQKLMRAEKGKFEKDLQQMEQIKEKLFPKGGLQERSTNFFQFCADGEVFSHLNSIYQCLDPFEKDFSVCYI